MSSQSKSFFRANKNYKEHTASVGWDGLPLSIEHLDASKVALRPKVNAQPEATAVSLALWQCFGVVDLEEEVPHWSFLTHLETHALG